MAILEKIIFTSLVYRLTNEAFFDMRISKNCKSEGVVDGERPLKFLAYNLNRYPDISPQL
jgi:hypothetical protein